MFRSLLIAAVLFAVGSDAVAEEIKRLAPGRVEIAVGDLHCKSCAKRVARKLYSVKGVKKVASSLADDLVVVTLSAKQAVPAVSLWSAVEAGGVPPVELRFGDKRLDVEAMKPLLAAAKQPAVTR